jgi:hypothetical protein
VGHREDTPWSLGHRDDHREDVPWELPRQDADLQRRLEEPQGNAINYLGNPCFRPRITFKMSDTSQEMQQHREMLANHAVVVADVGPMRVQTREEVKDIVLHQFGIRKLECYVYRSCPEPFIAVFPDSHDRDVVFAGEKAVDGPVELRFTEWGLNWFGEREVIPFHMHLSIEGIPQHAWFKEIVDKVFCDEAIVHFVEEDTADRIDQCAYRCWGFCKDPSKLPHVVFLSLSHHEQGGNQSAQIHFVRPRGFKHSHVFKVFIHIDVVEDLAFYHFPEEELLADGKVP